MPEMFVKKNRFSFKKAVFFLGLFLALFLSIFYIVNFLNFKPNQNAPVSSGVPLAADTNAEFKKRIGSTTVAMESYADWANRFGLNNGNNGLDADPDKDEMPNYLEYVYGTNPVKTDSDGDKFSDKQEIINGYDPDAPGDAKPIVEFAIPKINVMAPMVWSTSENEQEMLADLEKGVSHFAKTASPGQNGNMIISGHSSNYIWAKGNYNYIFKDLNNLAVGDVVSVKTRQKNGRVITYNYKISDKFVTVPNDERIFAATTGSTLTLSTCWPLGTNLRRLIVKAELVK